MWGKGFSSNLFQNPIPADTGSFLQKIYRSQNSYHIIIIFLCFCFCQPFGLDITWVKKRVCTLIIFIKARTCYPGRSFILTKDSSSAKLISYFHHDVLLLFSLFVNKLDNWSVIQIYRNEWSCTLYFFFFEDLALFSSAAVTHAIYR